MPPPPLTNGIWLNYVDLQGNQSAGLWTTQDQDQLDTGPYGDLLTATQNLTCMGLFGASFQRKKIITASAIAGAYDTYQDQAVMVVQSANKTMEMVIPGPVEEIFYDAGQLVDITNPLVVEWFTQVQAVLGDTIGSPWIQLRRGYRRKAGA